MRSLIFITCCIFNLYGIAQSPYKLHLLATDTSNTGNFSIQLIRDTGFLEDIDELCYTIFYMDEDSTIVSVYPHYDLSYDEIDDYIDATTQDTFTHSHSNLSLTPTNSDHTLITVFCEIPVWVSEEKYLTRGIGGRPPHLYPEELLDIISGNPNEALGLLYNTSTIFKY